MSLSVINKVFEQMSSTQAWSVCLVKVKPSKKNGISSVLYATRGITLKPNGTLNEFVDRMSAIYLGTENKKGKLSKFTKVTDYDGTAEETYIYKLMNTNELIENEFHSLTEALSTPSLEGEPLDFGASAYVLRTSMCLDEDTVPVLLFSMQNPVCVLKNKFLFEENDVFKQITQKVLNLRPTSDAIIVGNTVYLLTMAGENLFNMEHSYRAVCDSRVDEIGESEILSNFEAFCEVAKSGHNPRRFIAFNRDRFEKMKDREIRKIMAERFRIALTPDGKIDTEAEGAANNLVRVLCNKGMVDPFDDVPVEVSSVTRW
ncbi:MAG: DUF4868 domain-containing protein [Lachnospiraceae bacterium]|nr:DUF4868 domain-containing protein [Lachnospiraceae bacterium]